MVVGFYGRIAKPVSGVAVELGTMARTPVAQIVHALAVGGSETLAMRLGVSFQKHGYRCSVVGLNGGGALEVPLELHGLDATVLNRARSIDFRLLKNLVCHFRSRGTRLVHTHHLGPLMYGGAAARIVGAKIVHTEHAALGLEARRVQHLYRFCARFADRVTVVATHVGDFLSDTVGIPCERIELIPNGVRVEDYADVVGLRQEWGWSENHFVVACLARLDPIKGQRHLLIAHRALVQQRPHARLILIGDGVDRGALESLAKELELGDSVHFLGSRSDVPALLATADACVLPSLSEGLPMAVLEAMAAEKTVVATRVGSIPEVIQDNVNGILVPAGEPEALLKALLRLADSSKTRARLAREAKRTVEQRFSFDKMTEKYRAIYDSLLENQKAA